MRLITNVEKDSQSHLCELKNLLSASEQIVICSGWMKACGLSPLLKHMREAIGRGAHMTVYTNREHTERACIKSLASLTGLKHVNVPRPTYLHTKLYYGRSGDSYRAILGSANVTSGGLWKNEELSYCVSGKVTDDAHRQLTAYLQGLTALESRA
ncbi:phospholipase D-like domain-containing protein [Pseudomonas sp. CF161]|uniref:phospholipase D-like domain-containing protein n=1 Tax=Pseudomonas sp. CF161 TaxID=911241 RepID=UPI0012EBBE1D|nr:phospholipase D-like domain-containing protein [Pseudomonas sp. CF161]